MKQKFIILAIFAFSGFFTLAKAQWKPVGLQGNSLSSLVTNGTDIYAGGDYGGGVFRSIDSGLTWMEVNTGLPDKNIVSLGADATRIFAATDTSGIFISTNNGANWSALTGWK